MRRDVLEAAAGQKKILFPVFTNGTMIDADFRKLLCENRNLIPILSLEGKKDTTDTRRGKGTYQKLRRTMQELQENGILFGDVYKRQGPCCWKYRRCLLSPGRQ